MGDGHPTLKPKTPIPFLALAWMAVAWIAPELAPACLFDSFLGFRCPGCGSTRALSALLHGDLTAAWRLNPAFVLGLPLAGTLGLARRRRQRESSAAFLSSAAAPARSRSCLRTVAR